jgi:CBS-domain-containing membrane protein
MLVQDVMTSTPVTVTGETSVKDALVLLAAHEITAMPVVGHHGHISGVVSEADLIRDALPEDARAHEIPPAHSWRDHPTRVQDVMTPHAVTVRPDTDVAVAVDLLTSTSIKSVPVVDVHGRPVGMLSRSDVVRVLARSDADLERAVDALLVSVGLGDWVADVCDGIVTLSGPEGSADRAMAQLVASTVPGVLDVRVG